MNRDLARRATAEAIGTAILLAAVVGSRVMGERLAGGNVAIVLLANSIATGAALVALILTFSAISGAHFNPVVTLSEAWGRGLSWHDVPAYFVAQIIGAFAGVAVAHLMFGLPLFFASHRGRSGGAQNIERVCRNLWLGMRGPGRWTVAIDGCLVCCRCLHHGRVLVYSVDIVCQPCCNSCPIGE